ncbi:MAG: hypothetical protein IT433_11255 [Phycisphaerales bacterium]|nr:hypothetical protein [Phycisphaerales bacterium]
MNHEHTERLSASARARMERDLPSLRTRAANAPARRLLRRWASSMACVGLVVAGARMLSTPDTDPGQSTPSALLAAEGSALATPGPTRTAAPRGAIQTLTRSAPSATRMLDDDELLRALAEAGRADGIVRTRGRTHLASELLNAHAEVTAPRLP